MQIYLKLLMSLGWESLPIFGWNGSRFLCSSREIATQKTLRSSSPLEYFNILTNILNSLKKSFSSLSSPYLFTILSNLYFKRKLFKNCQNFKHSHEFLFKREQKNQENPVMHKQKIIYRNSKENENIILYICQTKKKFLFGIDFHH